QSLHDKFMDVVNNDPNADQKIERPNAGLQSYMLDERGRDGSGYAAYFYANTGHMKLLAHYTADKKMQFEHFDNATGKVLAIQQIDRNTSNASTEFFDNNGKLTGKLEITNAQDGRGNDKQNNIDAMLTKYDQNGNALPGKKVSVSFSEMIELEHLSTSNNV